MCDGMDKANEWCVRLDGMKEKKADWPYRTTCRGTYYKYRVLWRM